MAINNNYSGGNATVLTPFLSGITNTVAKQQQRIANQEAQEAKRLQQEQAELSDIVKKVNTTGVQQQDIPEVSERLDKVYETYYKANQAKTPQERLTLKMDLERELNDMSQLVNQSKQRGVAQVKLADFIGNPTNMGLVSQDAINRFKQNANLPTSKLSPTAFSRDEYVSPDTSYLDRVIDSSAKSLLDNANVVRRSGKTVNVSGKTGTEQFSEKAVGKDIFATDLFYQYDNDIKFKNLVDFTSAKNGITKDDYILSVVDNYDKANKLKNSKQVETVFARAPRQSGGGSKEDILGNFMQQSVEGLLKEDKDTLGRIRANLLPNRELEYVNVKKTKGNKTLSNRKGVRVKSPEEITGTTIIPAINEIVFYDNPNAATRLNKLLGIVTGEKVSGSKFGIMGGKTTGELAEPIIRDKTRQTKGKTTKGELD